MVAYERGSLRERVGGSACVMRMRDPAGIDRLNSPFDDPLVHRPAGDHRRNALQRHRDQQHPDDQPSVQRCTHVAILPRGRGRASSTIPVQGNCRDS